MEEADFVDRCLFGATGSLSLSLSLGERWTGVLILTLGLVRCLVGDTRPSAGVVEERGTAGWDFGEGSA